MKSIDYKDWERTKPMHDRAALEGLMCSMPGCAHNHVAGGPLILHARCHPGAATLTAYFHGAIYVSCSVCDRFIARLPVALIASVSSSEGFVQ